MPTQDRPVNLCVKKLVRQTMGVVVKRRDLLLGKLDRDFHSVGGKRWRSQKLGVQLDHPIEKLRQSKTVISRRLPAYPAAVRCADLVKRVRKPAPIVFLGSQDNRFLNEMRNAKPVHRLVNRAAQYAKLDRDRMAVRQLDAAEFNAARKLSVCRFFHQVSKTEPRPLGSRFPVPLPHSRSPDKTLSAWNTTPATAPCRTKHTGKPNSQIPTINVRPVCPEVPPPLAFSPKESQATQLQGSVAGAARCSTCER